MWMISKKTYRPFRISNFYNGDMIMRRYVVSNSVALIHIFRSNTVSLLESSFKKVWISPKVYRETVVVGKEKGFRSLLL